MTYNEKGCINLACAVLNQAREDYSRPNRRQEVQGFLFSSRFRLFCEIAGWPPARIRRTIMGKDCRRCRYLHHEHICIQCFGKGDGNDHFEEVRQ